jgi:hypothetical protein
MSYTRYLIEQTDTQEWMQEDGRLTKNALEAFMFYDEGDAIWHLIRVFNLSIKDGWKVTEHEFTIN